MTDEKFIEAVKQNASKARLEMEKQKNKKCTIGQKCPFKRNCFSESFECIYWKEPSREQSIADILQSGPLEVK